MSSVAQHTPNSVASRNNPSSCGISIPCSTASIAYFTASGAFAAIFFAIDLRGGEQVARLDHVIHQANAQRFVRGDHVAGKHQFVRHSFSAQPRQSLRSAVPGQNSELHFGLAELAPFCWRCAWSRLAPIRNRRPARIH